MQLFDTHAHLNDPQLLPQLDQVLMRAREAGLVGMTAIGTTRQTSEVCLQLAGAHADVHAAVGIHPNDCHQATDADWSQIVQWAQLPEVVAIGETGLDRYWDDCPIEVQRQWLLRHLDLAFETGKPLVVHMRDCETDILEMWRAHQREGRIPGIMHSFTGSWETAQACLDLGMWISFAGMVTFKKSQELREVAARIPADRLLIETDAPYLSPHPKRSIRPNEPALVAYTAACLAEVRGVSLETLAEQTTGNARRAFGLA